MTIREIQFSSHKKMNSSKFATPNEKTNIKLNDSLTLSDFLQFIKFRNHMFTTCLFR